MKSGAKESFGEACYLLGSIIRVKLDLQSHNSEGVGLAPIPTPLNLKSE